MSCLLRYVSTKENEHTFHVRIRIKHEKNNKLPLNIYWDLNVHNS